MSTESIQFALNECFSAPLPEFYKRRIVFWQDEDREFEAMLEELVIPGVAIIKLTGTNNFAVKKLLLHDDLTGNYLIYNPFAYDSQRDNWLRDIELFSEEFHADYISILMSELQVEKTPAMRRTMKTYSSFFASKERVQRLRHIGHTYQRPLQLHVDIMAVLAGVPGGSAQDVIISVLSAGLDEESNTVLAAINKFGSIEAFWQLVQKYTGFCHENGDPLIHFAAHILLSALAQTMNPSALKGLERFLSETNKAYCYSLVHEWSGREDTEDLYTLCRAVEQELQLLNRFEKLEVEALLTADIFPAINECIFSRLYDEIANRVVKTDLLLKVAANRRTAGWKERFMDYIDCLYYIGKMQEFYQNHAAGFHIVEPKAIWKLYGDSLYEMDSFYRHFYYAFGNTLKNSNPILEDRLKHAAEYVEGLYQNWYLKELNGCWVNAAAEDLNKIGYVSEIERQRNFYRHYVTPLEDKATRAFVIISDALRYEVASELCDRLTRETKGTAKLEAVQSVFPSITKFGMAALLPGQDLSLSEQMELLVDGMPTRSTAERNTILCSANKKSIATRYSDLLNMKRAERRELVSGKEVIYIYHNTIDAIGDKPTTEEKVFEACADAISELTNIVRAVMNDMLGTDIYITSDHGFLYTYSPLAESDKISRSTFRGEVFETGRRYAITDAACEADFLLPIQLDDEYSGAKIKGYTPMDSTRIKIAGGGENYVHGGISLQEMAVPIISFKNVRTTSKSYVEVSNAELSLLSESRKISNLLFSLDFFQTQPVGEKVQPCSYTVYMADEDGRTISDRRTVMADLDSVNANDRVIHVRFNLKAGAYNNREPYRLVITNGVDIPKEIEFHIDIAFADDFGFDL